MDQLLAAKSTDFFEIDYQEMALDDDLYVVSINLEKIFPLEEIQEELMRHYETQRELEKIEQRKKIAQIMGTSTEKKRSVVDYLIEKQQQVKNNAAVVYNIDLTSPMPQANDLKRVLEWGRMIAINPSEKIDLTVLENDLEKRDVHYYSRALFFLGLVYVDSKSLCLTYAGEKFFKQDEASQKAILLDILCQDELLSGFISNSITKEDIISEFNRRGITGSTVERRLSCLESWKNFLLS